MILVTVGTQSPFDRLVQASDEWALENPDKVFAHIGQSRHQPRYKDFADRVSSKAAKDLVGKSELIIAHAGMESILTGLEYSKPVIIVPRLAQWENIEVTINLRQCNLPIGLDLCGSACIAIRCDNQVRVVTAKLNLRFRHQVAEKAVAMAKMESLSAVAGGASTTTNY